MNVVFKEAAATAQYGWLMGLVTLLFFVAFVGWAWWAYAPSRREQMNEYGRMPLDDGGL